MTLVSFDLEIASDLPGGAIQKSTLSKIDISCAALATVEPPSIKTWHSGERLRSDDARDIVFTLLSLQSSGYRIVTWNGCSFDFRLLATQSGFPEECSYLALNHTDLMLCVTFSKGWYLALDKALAGAGIRGKVKRVRLSDGSVLNNMDGSLAPSLWRNGEYSAVLEYLTGDVLSLLELATHVMSHKKMRWTSNSGKSQELIFDYLPTVQECFDIQEPDVSWMSNPPARIGFVDWIFPSCSQLPSASESARLFPKDRFQAIRQDDLPKVCYAFYKYGEFPKEIADRQVISFPQALRIAGMLALDHGPIEILELRDRKVRPVLIIESLEDARDILNTWVA